MHLSKSDLKLIIPFILFLMGGIYGLHSADYIQNNKALSTAFKWFIIPSIIIGAYYTYRSFDFSKKRMPRWKIALGLLALTPIISSVFLISFQGYLVLYNCNVGTQKNTFVKGQVIKLHYPKPKKALNDYEIEIKNDDNNEIIKLVVPTCHYSVGQIFEKELTMGSLGFLYCY